MICHLVPPSLPSPSLSLLRLSFSLLSLITFSSPLSSSLSLFLSFYTYIFNPIIPYLRHYVHLSTYGPQDPIALLLVLCDLGCKAADPPHYIRTHFIDRFSLDIYSLPYGSPQRRINDIKKKKPPMIKMYVIHRVYHIYRNLARRDQFPS